MVDAKIHALMENVMYVRVDAKQHVLFMLKANT